jgi:hypothetical protein
VRRVDGEEGSFRVPNEYFAATDMHVLRPHRHLLTHGVSAVLALTTPVFAVLYWLTIPVGGWPVVLIMQVAVLLVFALLIVGYFGTSIAVSPDGLRERGFFGRARVTPRARIDSILLIEVYRDAALDTQPNLFVCDADGALLVRMRGQYWSRENMEYVADTLDLPVEAITRSLTLGELRRSRPDLLYWFERFPVVG